jgi:hypothetical protein
MTKREQKGAVRRSGMLIVDRLLYERRPGGGRFVTFTRWAQLGLLALFVGSLALAAVSTTALVLGYRHYRAQMALLQAAPAPQDAALAEARLEADRLRAALEEARGERRDDAGALEAARAALEVEKRAAEAALETARARIDLLTQQVESGERARQKLAAELDEARRQAAAAVPPGGEAEARLESLL